MFLVETDMEKRKTLEIILNCCSTMDKLISDIMDYTKMQSMRFVLDEAPFDIRKCISAVINANSVKANEKGLSLSVFISPEVPQKAIGDERRIQQILNNLVSNAVKFTTIGYVRLELYVTGKEDNHMELSALVIDTGIGIAEDERSRLFQSFSQVDSSIGRKFGGTGLGLYVSKQLSNMMGGDITFESRKGKGSTFSVSFFLQYESQENRITDSYEELQDEMSQIDFDMGTDAIFIRGTAKNQTEIRNNLERLMLCIEMHSFSNAEQITENLRILLKGYSEIGGGIFLKLLMAIRNEDYEKSCLQYTVLFDAVSKNL